MPQAKTGGKTVSEKSTKTELWEAYNVAMQDLSGQPKLEFASEKQDSGKIGKTIDDLKAKFNAEVTLVSDGISTELTRFVEFAEELNKKKAFAVKEIENKKDALLEEIAKAKKLLGEEAVESEKSRKREEDEYVYFLSQKRRKEEDEYKIARALDKAEIAEKKAALTTREVEIKQMEKDLAESPKIIEKAVNDAIDSTTKELNAKYLAEIKELNLNNEHEKKIASLKIEELTKKVAEQKVLIDKIEKELAIANREAKEIAVSVIESRSVGPSTSNIE